MSRALTPLLVKVEDAGLTVQVDGDNLVVKPKARITPELRAEMLARKADLLEHLRWDEDEAYTLLKNALMYVAERYHDGDDTGPLDVLGDRIDAAFRAEDMFALRSAVREYVYVAVSMFRPSRGRRAA